MIQNFSVIEQILSCYRDGVYLSIEANGGLVGEYFGKFEDRKGTRLLCQTRSIYFLIKMYELFEDHHALNAALKLYRETEAQYKIDDGWKAARHYSVPTEDLYELSFLSYAQLYLSRCSKEIDINNSAVATLSKLLAIIERKNCYPEMIHYKGFISQNPLMHAFESFVAATEILGDKSYLTAAAKILKIVEDNFFDSEAGLPFEVAVSDKNATWYEPGHGFEWSTLLLMAAKEGLAIHGKMIPRQLIENAEQFGVVSNGLVVSRVFKDKFHKELAFRIWSQLERVRALFAIGNRSTGNFALDFVLSQFFTDKFLPSEYIGQEVSELNVKTTTGYHIINCFEEVRRSSTKSQSV